MRRTAALLVVLTLATSIATGAAHKTALAHVRHHTRALLRSLGREIKSWTTSMHSHVRSLRREVDRSAAEVKRVGRQGVTEIQKAVKHAQWHASHQIHKGLTLVAREFTDVGAEARARPEAAAPREVRSPVADPLFLRHHDILLAWYLSIGSRAIRRSHLLDDHLLLEDVGGDLYAFNPRNGITNWVYPLPAPSMFDYRTDDDHIVIVSKDIVLELDRAVGLPHRRQILPFPIASRPDLHGDFILASSSDDRIYCINRETRARLWSYLATGHVVAGVAAVANTVYVAQTDGKVFAHVPGRPRPMWEYKADDAVRVDLVTAGDNLYFPADDLFVHAMNRLGGFRVWKFPVRGHVSQPVWVERQTVYFAADGDGFYAVSREEGEQLWHVPGAKWPVAVGKKNLYLQGTKQEIWCVDRATGKKLWAVSAVPFTHFVRNTTTDYIYLVTDLGQLYAFYIRGDHLEKKAVPPEKKPPLRPPEVGGPGKPPAKP